jgi:3-oxoacyl-[acyl-carrier protein] reductase
MRWNDISFDFSGASVLVTGGTGGIGGAIAEAFRDAGAHVTITGTRGSAAEYDGDLSGYRYAQLDVEDREGIDALAAGLERLDVLVNSAGVALLAMGLDEYDPDIFERAVTMHLTSVHRLASRCHGLLSRSTLPGGGSMVSLASASSFFGIEAVPAYGAAKTGLLGLTRALAVHWATNHIRVNAIAAGLVKSGFTTPIMAHEAINQAMLARTPLGRHGDPADISGAALFLSSSAAAWITGQVLAVDGGFMIAG